MKWTYNIEIGNHVLENKEGKVYLSYQPNDFLRGIFPSSELDSSQPETAIVLIGDKVADYEMSENMKKEYPDGKLPRFLIYRGDWREELEKIYPDIEKLKAHWKEHGGHFWSDSL